MSMQEFTNSKRKLIFVLCLLLFAGFFATSIASYYVSRNAIRQSIMVSELPLTADNVYSEIQKDLIRPIFISSMMASDTFVRDWVLAGEQDEDKISRYLREVKETYSTFSSFFVSDHTRRYYYADGLLKTIDEKDELDAWYFRVRTMETPYEINVDPDAAHDNALTIFINYKVLDYQGNFIGATGVGLTVDAVRSLINTYQDRYQRNIYFVDQQGKVVLYGNHVQPVDSSIHDFPGLDAVASEILSKPSGSYQYTHEENEVLLNVRFIPELNWYLFVEKNENEAVREIRQTLYLNLIICAVITAFALLMTTMTIRRYQDKLELMATSDLLTQLPNRQAFEVVSRTFMHDARRNDEALSLLLLDIDDFKQINDRYGHVAGDTVIRAVADVLSDNLRESDFLCRWGGEEFLILLKNCDGANALQLSEKLRLAIEMLQLNINGQHPVITASFGASEWKRSEVMDVLIDRADRALYQAKAAGRNRSQLA
ncbi:Diguanylate cyclase DosC [Methylophilaceae bacterium]|nr:Diguanylate cyclase DosC [Methylophilaceae bacterium]